MPEGRPYADASSFAPLPLSIGDLVNSCQMVLPAVSGGLTNTSSRGKVRSLSGRNWQVAA